MKEYDKELEGIIKYTIAYMVAERKEEEKDSDKSMAWEMINNIMRDETKDKV